MRHFVHYFLHLGMPGILAYFLFPSKWKQAWMIMLATMAVDLDHLLADPMFDPERCSIGFHPLHSWFVQPLYIAMLFHPKTRIIGIGLCLHMLTDLLDCCWMKYL